VIHSAKLLKTIDEKIDCIQKFAELPLKQQSSALYKCGASKFTGSLPVDGIISEIDLLPQYVSDLKMSEEMNREYKQYIEERNKIQRVFYIPRCGIQRAVDCLLPYDDIYSQICAIALLSGRKLLEILKSTFEPCELGPSWCIMDGTTQFPLLCHFYTILPFISDIQAQFGDYAPEEAHNKLAKRLSMHAKNLVLQEKCTFSMFRLYYCVLSHDRFGEGYTLIQWYCAIYNTQEPPPYLATATIIIQ
jgi:hypothetical protein